MTAREPRAVRIGILMMKQDDPRKCTAAKMIRLGLAEPARRIPRDSIVLHPYSETVLTPLDRTRTGRICAVDCSWRLARTQFSGGIPGRRRLLPPLLAGNPVNYSKIGMLSTAEAVAAAMHIMGFQDVAAAILDKFRWGHTFLELNAGPLKEYSQASGEEEMYEIAESYGMYQRP